MKNNFYLKLYYYLIIGVPSMFVLFLFLFSVYPNYILSGHHGTFYYKSQKIANSILLSINNKIHKTDRLSLDSSFNNNSGQSNITIPTVYQPLIEIIQPQDVPERLYFTKPVKPLIFHTTMIPDPFTTYAPLPGYGYQRLVYHNKQQFRYPEDLEKKRDGEIRIFITGSSAAWGCMASDYEHIFSALLEKKLRIKYSNLNIKVINAAVSAWSSTQERTWILNRITEYEPDLIIQYSGSNDIWTVYNSHTDLFDTYMRDGAYYRYAIACYELYNRGEMISRAVLNASGGNYQPSDFPRKTLKNIEIVNAYLKFIKVPYVYVLQPNRKQSEKDHIALKYFNSLSKELSSMAKKDGFVFINHTSLFDNHNELFYDNCHVGDRGNEIISNDLLNKINWDIILNPHCSYPSITNWQSIFSILKTEPVCHTDFFRGSIMVL